MKIHLCNLQSYQNFSLPTPVQISLDTAHSWYEYPLAEPCPYSSISLQDFFKPVTYSIMFTCFCWHEIACNMGLQRTHQSLGNHLLITNVGIAAVPQDKKVNEIKLHYPIHDFGNFSRPSWILGSDTEWEKGSDFQYSTIIQVAKREKIWQRIQGTE